MAKIYGVQFLLNPDSHEFLGDDENTSNQAKGTTATTTAASNNTKSKAQDSDQDDSMETETTSETAAGEKEAAGKENGEEVEQEMETADAGGVSSGDKGEEKGEEEEREGEGEGEKAQEEKEEEQEYNPLIVRRSNRAIKPTKDVDLYLLGAQFGIDLEGSDADSSDQEFAPAVESDREFQHFILVGACTAWSTFVV